MRLNWGEEGNRIDDAARDGKLTLAPRLVVAIINTVILAMNFGWQRGALWFLVNGIGEGGAWLASRTQARGLAGSQKERLPYLTFVFVMTSNWTIIAAFYWFSQNKAFEIIAIVGLTAQLVHAQAFTFKSRVVLLINGGMPSAAMIVLPVFFGGYAGNVLVTVAGGTIMVIAYVWASAHSNAIVAENLTTERRNAEEANRAKSVLLALNRSE